MAERTCTIEGCERKHCARGLCSMHWKREYGTRTKYPRTCDTCRTEYLSERPSGRFCSDRCKGDWYSEHEVAPPGRRATKCALPPDHPVIRETVAQRARVASERAQAKSSARAARLAAWRTGRECPGCGCTFSPLRTPVMLTCSVRCARRVARWRRRAAEVSAVGSFTWSGFMRIAQRFNFNCAYCGTRSGQLDPDHVVPLSRGGMNSTANLLPSCRACNGDKRDLFLDEWAVDRERRGKPPRATSWAPEDKRYWHLTQEALRISSAA